MNKTELKVFLKGLANFYVVLIDYCVSAHTRKRLLSGTPRAVHRHLYDRKHRDLFGRLFLEPNQKGSG